jgi:hypothetical protein
MDKYSVEKLKQEMPSLDLYLDTLSIQIELEKIQDFKWVASGTEENPSFTIYPDDRTCWVLSPNGQQSRGVNSWFGRSVKVLGPNGSKKQNPLISVRICVLQDGLAIANLSLESLSVRAVLMKARIRLAD